VGRVLPLHHAAPADRRLLTQASNEGLRVVSADEVMRLYRTDVIDATR
jgi:PIN domain nuclease of toxin-antitoxin system